MISPAIYLGREPTHPYLTDANEQTIRVANWLDERGYPSAAEEIRSMMETNETVTLVELAKHEGLRHALLSEPNLLVRIISMCYHPYGYWRPNAGGYTGCALTAGLYTMEQAWKASGHVSCSDGRDEKGIVYELIDTTVPAEPARQRGWKAKPSHA